MHDTTCTPALADIAAMRDQLAMDGVDPARLNPILRVDVSVDHSLSVDAWGVAGALARNMTAEITRNAERYRFMKWASAALDNVHVHPPGTGIMHTMNLEQLSTVVAKEQRDGHEWLIPDTLLGTDSHTPMVNGIGVLGWGIGGLEAESVLFGFPVTLRLPEVVGVRLTGRLAQGVTSTDLALTLTEMLRANGVAGAFVEFFGPGVSSLSAGDRAVVANMAPEYGATTGFFPVDASTVAYLRQTGRPDDLTSMVEPALRAIGLWFDPDRDPIYSSTLHLDLGKVQTCLAGPRRPQDRLLPHQARTQIEIALGRPLADTQDGVPDGAVAIAAITSCTNTSDPRLLVMAALLARKARAFGLTPKPWVKTSFAPGSPSAERMLKRAGLLDDLASVGFQIVGFGCTTCIGNSGALPPAVRAAAASGRAMVAVLSGNRNFPGRVHPDLDLGYLASPPLVVAFSLAGYILPDIQNCPIASDAAGREIYLRDLWPNAAEVDAALALGLRSNDVPDAFAQAGLNGDWQAIDAPCGPRFTWDPASRALRPPAFVTEATLPPLRSFIAAPLLVLGDDITTDHISPAGRIDPDSSAGCWLMENGADSADLNVYASYRGNWEVMLRGLFANKSVQNLTGEPSVPVWERAAQFRARGTDTVIIAGERYGMGSSRDWAAKGTALLGVRAVLARSFERIHRTNLIGMGILPIEIPSQLDPMQRVYRPGDRIKVSLDPEHLAPGAEIQIVMRSGHAEEVQIEARLGVETASEIKQLQRGGLIPMILSKAKEAARESDHVHIG
jgi:aconitate hydratase